MALQIGLRKNATFTFEKLLQTQFHYSACSLVNKRKQNQQNTIVKATVQMANVGKSLAAKGFLRSTKPYSPSMNVKEKVEAICATLQIPFESSHKLTNLEEKFKFLEACYNDFQHSVPNSQVHELNTIADVIEFYKTTVDTTVPYDALKKIDLPENLHIQYDYVRFHPDTDTKFNGQTAFPKSSTLVTGLKYRGKYPGHEAKRSWP